MILILEMLIKSRPVDHSPITYVRDEYFFKGFFKQERHQGLRQQFVGPPDAQIFLSVIT
jgi:hypothetical protein